MMILYSAMVAAAITSLASAQIPYLGRCPENITPMADFNMTKFIGRWYEAERYFRIAQFGEKCVSMDYIEEPYGGIKVMSRSKSVVSGANSAVEIHTMFKPNSSDAEMYLAYTSYFLAPYVTPEMPNWIIDTDYDNYAVVWSCTQMGFFSIRNAWILTKERHPSIGTMEKAYAALDASNISKAYFFRTDQNNCSGFDDKPIEWTTTPNTNEASSETNEASSVSSEKNEASSEANKTSFETDKASSEKNEASTEANETSSEKNEANLETVPADSLNIQSNTIRK